MKIRSLRNRAVKYRIPISNLYWQSFRYRIQIRYIVFQEPVEKVFADFKAIKTVISKLRPEHVQIVLKAIPILIPHIIEHHTPKLEEFLKPGTKFTKQELFTVHQSLKEWHIFVQKLQDQTEKSELPTIHRLTDMILKKNTKLMSLKLMISSKTLEKKQKR